VPSWPLRKFLATNLERGDDGRWSWVINLPALTQALPELEKNPLRPGERYDGPVMFIKGGTSGYIEASDWAAITEVFPAADLKVIAKSGHNPHMEAREEFVALIE
jgi:pimeloyl-ACP methyl ester carboxylesterase